MFKKTFAKVSIFFAATALCASAAVAPQTVKDSMDGNWPVINEKKLFMSGMNLAWSSFASDVGDKPLDIGKFTDYIKQLRKAGGNVLRWWLHTDAQNCPKINATGAVTGLGASTIKNLRCALDTAYANGVVLDMCLFSFDLLVPDTTDGKPGKAGYSSYNLENNYKFLTDTANITSYLNNALKPILDSVGSHPAVMCWEVFNEPEGMLASAGWDHVTKKITQNDILRITNRIAGFVHRNSKKMVSTGIASFQYVNQYSTAKLVAAGGDQDGYLDFYMAHYYPEWQDESICPFYHPASFWNMDKPILIGEFPAKDWSTSDIGKDSHKPLYTSMKIEDAYSYAYDNGYAGAMSWSMTEGASDYFGNYETTAPALKALYDEHKSDIMIKDVIIKDLTGDLCMAAAFDLPEYTYPEAQYNANFDFTGVDSLKVDLYLPPGTETTLLFKLIVKSTGWSYCPTSKIYKLSKAGTWLTYSAPISSFAPYDEGNTLDLADIKQVGIGFYTNASSFKGSIYIDNVRYQKGTTETIISDFNKTGSTWGEYESGSNDNLQLSLVEKPENSTIIYSRLPNNNSLSRFVTVSGRKLIIKQDSKSISQIRIVDIMGKAALNTNVIGNNRTVDCGKLAAGNYLLEVVQGNSSYIQSIFLQ